MRRFMGIALCILMCGVVATESAAEADIGVKAVGGRLAYVAPDGPDNAIGFGVIVDLGQFTPEIGFQATGDYWSKSENVGPYDYKYSVMSFGARAIYEFAVSNPKLKPFAGAGLAFHRASVDIPVVTVLGTRIGGGDATDTKLGLDLVGGAGYAVGEKVDVQGEARYRTGADQFELGVAFVFWLGGGGAKTSTK